jgi:hypothetical protein
MRDIGCKLTNERQHVSCVKRLKKYGDVLNTKMQAVSRITVQSRGGTSVRFVPSSYCNVNPK